MTPSTLHPKGHTLRSHTNLLKTPNNNVNEKDDPLNEVQYPLILSLMAGEKGDKLWGFPPFLFISKSSPSPTLPPLLFFIYFLMMLPGFSCWNVRGIMAEGHIRDC